MGCLGDKSLNSFKNHDENVHSSQSRRVRCPAQGAGDSARRGRAPGGRVRSYRLIDPVYLLRELNGDVAAFRNLSRMYLRITPAMLASVQCAVSAAADAGALARASHALRGATSLMGATALTALLLEFEQHARHNSAWPDTAAMDQLAWLFTAVAIEIGESILHFHGERTPECSTDLNQLKST